jgi:hypothetical protein
MLFSLAHHLAPTHHLEAVAAALLAAAVVTGGYLADRPDTRPRVVVSRVETPAATAAPTTVSGAGSATANRIGVTVPTPSEIRAQCVAAGLLAECRAAGLR